MKAMDKRVNKTNEILTGMKVLKLYGWEEAMKDIVNEHTTTCAHRVDPNP